MIDLLRKTARRMRRAKIQEISVVGSPAVPLSSVARTLKSGAVEMPIVKSDPARNMVFGVVSVATVKGREYEDLQGDVWDSADAMADAAYDFTLNSRVAGEDHRKIGVGRLVESVALTAETQKSIVAALKSKGIDARMELNSEVWWIGLQLTPDVFAKVADGTYKAFSIGGTIERKSNDDGDDEMTEEQIQAIVDKAVAKAVGGEVVSKTISESLSVAVAKLRADGGSAVTKSDDVISEVNRLADQLVEKSGLTMPVETARARIWKSRPDLYQRYKQALYRERGDPRARIA